MKNITDKMYNKKWGVFTHYLCHCDNWSERVAALDIGNIVDTPVRVKAGYYFITMMQGHKYMLAPNAAYDSIVGAKPGENCAERDVPVELSSELKKHGIDLYLYFTGDGPFRDEKEGKAFGLTRASGEVVTLPFVKKWA